MSAAHLKVLEQRHVNLEKNIHEESKHAARNTLLIEQLKKKKLVLKEEIERLRKTAVH